MATLTDDFLDLFDHYSTGLMTAKWSAAPADTISTATSGPWAGQHIMTTATSNTYRSLAVGSSVIYAGYSWLGLLVSGEKSILNIVDNTTLRPLGLQVLSSGQLRIRTGGIAFNTAAGTIVATTAAPKIQEGVWYTVEMAVRIASTTDYSIEVRIDGVVLGELTTTDIGGSITAASNPLVSWSPGQLQYAAVIASNSSFGWYAQKRGSSLWTSTTTGSTRATISDFIGVRLKTTLYLPSLNTDAAVAPYGYGTVLSGSGVTSNWTDGSGSIATFPAEMRETVCDSDTGYGKNATAPTGVIADRYSVAYADLPVAATSVGFVQRTIVARSDSAVSAKLITGMLNAGSPVADGAAFTVGAQYTVYPKAQTQPPSAGTDIWTVARVNAAQAYTTLDTLT